MKVLTKEGQDLSDEFESRFGDGCCSCHINPPCGYCTHPGNPSNLEDSEDMWEDDDCSKPYFVVNGSGFSGKWEAGEKLILTEVDIMNERKFKINDSVVTKKVVDEYIGNYNNERFEAGNFYNHVTVIASDENKHLISVSGNSSLLQEGLFLHIEEIKPYIIRKLSERLIYVSEFNFNK